ncbi:MAG: helix-turn-helix transcriptional regulator [Bacilli bacterium]|nr:helix-turn-helix transcriptional regulator [Bacilli bacterium]
MDCKKIGKYIKIKRMRVGLTQDELGDKLGVTGKAVSKWECGVALPDVSLFNDLANILQIEVSELLTGEDGIKKEIDYKNRRLMYRLGMIIFILIVLVVFFGLFFINNYNKVHVYDLVSAHSDFYVEGKLITIGTESYLSISDVKFVDNKYNTYAIVKNFNYSLIASDKVIYNSKEIDDEEQLNYYIRNINIFSKFELKKGNSFCLKILFLNSKNENSVLNIPIETRK